MNLKIQLSRTILSIQYSEFNMGNIECSCDEEILEENIQCTIYMIYSLQ